MHADDKYAVYSSCVDGLWGREIVPTPDDSRIDGLLRYREACLRSRKSETRKGDNEPWIGSSINFQCLAERGGRHAGSDLPADGSGNPRRNRSGLTPDYHRIRFSMREKERERERERERGRETDLSFSAPRPREKIPLPSPSTSRNETLPFAHRCTRAYVPRQGRRSPTRYSIFDLTISHLDRRFRRRDATRRDAREWERTKGYQR